MVEVISLGDVIWQDESVEFTGTVFANSITIRGRVDAFVAGDLVIENDLTVEQGALSKVASNTLEVKGDANILGELMVLKSEGDNSLYIREHHKVYDFNQDNLVARLNITESNIDKFVQIRFKVPPTGGHGSLPEFDNTYSFSGTAQIQCDEKYQRAFEGKYDADFAVFIVTCPLTELGEYTLNVEGNVEGSMMISDISSEHLYFSNEGQVVSFYDDLPPGMFELFIDNLGERSDRRLELFSDYRNSINMTNLQTGEVVDDCWQPRPESDETVCIVPRFSQVKLSIDNMYDDTIGIRNRRNPNYKPIIISDITVSGDLTLQSYLAAGNVSVNGSVTIESISSQGHLDASNLTVQTDLTLGDMTVLEVEFIDVRGDMTHFGQDRPIETTLRSLNVGQKLTGFGQLNVLPSYLDGISKECLTLFDEATCNVTNHLSSMYGININANRIEIDTSTDWLKTNGVNSSGEIPHGVAPLEMRDRSHFSDVVYDLDVNINTDELIVRNVQFLVNAGYERSSGCNDELCGEYGVGPQSTQGMNVGEDKASLKAVRYVVSFDALQIDASNHFEDPTSNPECCYGASQVRTASHSESLANLQTLFSLPLDLDVYPEDPKLNVGSVILIDKTNKQQFLSVLQPGSGGYIQPHGAENIARGEVNSPEPKMVDESRQYLTTYLTVGKHDISNIDELNQSEWIITVDGDPWLSNREEFGRSLAGLRVRLFDASESSIDAVITGNTDSSLHVTTEANLNGFVPTRLQGLHQFESIHLVWSEADFANDIVESNSLILNKSTLRADSVSEEALSALWQAAEIDLELDVNQPITVERSTVDSPVKKLVINAQNIIIDRPLVLADWPRTQLRLISSSNIQLNDVVDSGSYHNWVEFIADGDIEFKSDFMSSEASVKANSIVILGELYDEYHSYDATKLTSNTSITINKLSGITKIDFEAPENIQILEEVFITRRNVEFNSENTISFMSNVKIAKDNYDDGTLLLNGTGTIVFDKDLVLNDTNIASEFGSLTVNGLLSAGNNVSIKFKQPNAINFNDGVTVNGSLYINYDGVLNVSNDLTIDGNLVLRDMNTEKDAYQGLIVGGNITLNQYGNLAFEFASSVEQAGITDLIGYKSIPSFSSLPSCIGKDCPELSEHLAYLTANSLINNGELSLDISSYSSWPNSAFVIDIDSLSGNGKIHGGERLIINAVDNSFAGEYSSQGTVYTKDGNEIYGNLLLNIEDNPCYHCEYFQDVIKLPEIGRHTISNIRSLGNNQWEITANSANWKLLEDTQGFNITGEYVDLDAGDNVTHFYQILRHSSNSLVVITNDDLSTYTGRELVGVHVFNSININSNVIFDLGDDVLHIEDVEHSSVSETSLHRVTPSNSSVAALFNGKPEYHTHLILDGDQLIDEDSSFIAEKMTVKGSLTIDSGSLSNFVIDKSLDVEGDLIIGQARVISSMPNGNLNVSGTMKVTGTIPRGSSQLQLDNLNISENIELSDGGVLSIDANSIDVSGNLKVQDSAYNSIKVGEININGNINVNGGGSLSIAAYQNINVLQDIELNSSRSTSLSAEKRINVGKDLVAESRLYLNTGDITHIGNNLVIENGDIRKASTDIHGLKIDVVNQATIGENGRIDVTGMQGSFDNEGVNCFTSTNKYLALDCTYGSYFDVNYGGVIGTKENDSKPGSPGAYLKLTANEIIHNGTLLANSTESRNYYWGSSGGAILLEAYSLSGTGVIEAKPTAARYMQFGNGGRVVVKSDVLTEFNAQIKTLEFASYESEQGEAGTVYIADKNGKNGILTIDNIRQNWTTNNQKRISTPIRGAGKHQIDCVTSMGGNLWRLDTDCSADNNTEHWNDSNIDKKRSLIGRMIDPDIYNPLDHAVEIVSNDKNSLVVRTPQDLSNYAGATLQGIHLLKGLKVINSANVDFGNNRVEVSDINEAVFTPDVSISLGSANQELVEKLNSSGANIIWH